MTGLELKDGRRLRGLTQQQAAARFGVTQAYLSMLENERRAVPDELAAKFGRAFDLPPTALPLLEKATVKEFAVELGALGYPGFKYLRRPHRLNPATFLLAALDQPELDSRVVEGLPWLVREYAGMDWDWLVPRVKVRDRQNRLGFLVTLAFAVAQKRNDPAHMSRLKQVQTLLERSRLVAEDTLCHESMTEAERKWLRNHRSREALHWNLLTDLRMENLDAAS